MRENTKTYPSDVLVNQLRAAGHRVGLMWEIKGPKDTMIAWISCYLVNGDMIVHVLTYHKGNGWEYLMPGVEMQTDKVVDDVIAHIQRIKDAHRR